MKRVRYVLEVHPDTPGPAAKALAAAELAVSADALGVAVGPVEVTLTDRDPDLERAAPHPERRWAVAVAPVMERIHR